MYYSTKCNSCKYYFIKIIQRNIFIIKGTHLHFLTANTIMSSHRRYQKHWQHVAISSDCRKTMVKYLGYSCCRLVLLTSFGTRVCSVATVQSRAWLSCQSGVLSRFYSIKWLIKIKLFRKIEHLNIQQCDRNSLKWQKPHLRKIYLFCLIPFSVHKITSSFSLSLPVQPV